MVASILFLPALVLAIAAIHYRALYLEMRDRLARFAELTNRSK